MSILLRGLCRGALLSLSIALCLAPCLAQDSNSAGDKDAKQLQTDASELSADQTQLEHYKQQAKWYDDFAQKRLTNASAERKEVQARLQALETLQASTPAYNDPKSNIAQEVKALQGWLADEAAKRKLIEQTRERWRSAVASQTAKVQSAGYQVDVDKASVSHDQEQAKEQAVRDKDNPKPKPPQVQQNTVLMPGWETEQGSVPVLPVRPQGN